MTHLHLIEIFFIHMYANDNCRYLTTEKENRLSTVCAITARKSFSQTAFRWMSRSVMPTLTLFQVQFTNPISLSHWSDCLDTPVSFSILGAHTEIVSLLHFLWQYVLHVDICFSWFSQVCLLSSCLLSPNNSSRCTLHNSQRGHVVLFHLTERQAMMLGHMSSLKGHASYKPLSIGKAEDCFFCFLSSQVHWSLLWFGF